MVSNNTENHYEKVYIPLVNFESIPPSFYTWVDSGGPLYANVIKLMLELQP